METIQDNLNTLADDLNEILSGNMDINSTETAEQVE